MLRCAFLWGACAFFFLAGLAIIPLPGIQNDEALFSSPLYESAYDYGSLTLFGRKISLMLISYLGSFKTWLYWVVFKIARPSVWSVRLPMLAVGTVTVWLFWRLAERLGGTRAAVIGALLLATDAMFVLTTVLDWGPVVFQHFFLVAALVLALRFHDTGSQRALFGVFLLFGLALWDKALFLWTFGGLLLAAFVVLPRELRRAFTWRRLLLAGSAFCLGAWPLIYWNLVSPGETVRANASFTLRELGPKAVALHSTLAGKPLFGYVVGEAWFDGPRAPKTTLQKVSVWMSEMAGEPRSSVFPYIVLLAVALLPLVWRTRARRPALFSIIVLLVAWFQMAITVHAGASVHHVVLLWPVPHLLVALVFAELSRRFGRAAIVVVAVLACGSNVILLNQYYSQLVRFGAPSVWSDAISTLTDRLKQVRADHIFMMDWGMIDNVRMLSRGRLPIHIGMDAVGKEPPDEAERALFRHMVELPNSVFVSFTERWEQVEGTNRRMATMATQLGYRSELVELVKDHNGRPVFMITRFISIT